MVIGCLRALTLLLALWPIGSAVAEAPPQSPAGDVEVMKSFVESETPDARRGMSDERKHVVLFIMGVSLLVFILITAVLGINMAIFGKRVFVAHTIFAGLTVTLAITHAVIAIVWFFPF